MTDKKLIERAREQFKLDVEQERDIRNEAETDLHFVAGENQWNEQLKRDRIASNRPVLTFSKLHTYIQVIANEARQNKPQPKVNPLSGGATTDTANVLNGILRHIQYRSHADVASDTALDYSAGGSFGYIRFTSEYADPKSFDQELRILPVNDPFSVYGILIPACRGIAPRHAFVVQPLEREEYKRKYGSEEDPVDFEASEWKDCGDWIDAKNVRIAEYWSVETEKKCLRMVLGQDGSTAPIYTDDAQYSEELPFVPDPETGQPMERDVEVDVVTSCMMDGTRVLPGTKTTWLGDSIPIEAVLGRLMIIEGEVKLFSLIRHVREPQQLINVYKTAIAEKIALGNRVPYVGYKGQFKDPKWEDANTNNYPYLEAEPITIEGNLAPIPQRQQMEEQIQALSMAAASEIDDLKSGMGIFDQSLGEGKNEQSGVGIQSRQRQSNITNYHFADNLNRAEWNLCLKMLKVIPKVYDRPGRQVRIVGEDQQHSVVVVNQAYQDQETGAKKHYPLDVGEYDVVITVGPSFSTARQEGAETLQQFFQAAPQTVPILGDLWVGSLDYPWAREGARRLKAAAPQQIVTEPQEGGPKIPPEIQQQMQAMQQELQQAHQFASSLHEQIATKAPEIASKERMHMADLDFKREQLSVTAAVGEAQAKNVAAIALLNQEIAVIKAERAHTMATAAQQADHAHQQQMQAADHQHQASQQEADQTHQAGMQQDAQQGASEQSAQDAQQAQDAQSEGGAE